MQKVVADINVEGQVKLLIRIMRSHEPWGFYLNGLIEFKLFEDLGIPRDANDRVIWNAMQQHKALLLTDNRNHDGFDSLQAVIDDSNTATSFPVITLANARKIRKDRDYALKAIESWLIESCLLKKFSAQGESIFRETTKDQAVGHSCATSRSAGAKAEARRSWHCRGNP